MVLYNAHKQVIEFRGKDQSIQSCRHVCGRVLGSGYVRDSEQETHIMRHMNGKRARPRPREGGGGGGGWGTAYSMPGCWQQAMRLHSQQPWTSPSWGASLSM